jgi:ubiquinone/menaquinone biosynthesis C-methylase UbiE
MSTQKQIFLESEGDAWHQRNKGQLSEKNWLRDPIVEKMLSLPMRVGARVLEVGCGRGDRLRYLSSRLTGMQFFGIDPSELAVNEGREMGLRLVQGTADKLPHDNASIDILIFGFCLYLCDDEDLFGIAREADRVLADQGWLLIMDFEAAAPLYKVYHHRPGILTRKMSYKEMFLWHPSYTLASYEKLHHVTMEWTDERDEWIALTCLRKNRRWREQD